MTMSAGRALDVGILDAQHEDAAMPAREQPVEKRGAGAADVEIAGRRGRETDAERRGKAQTSVIPPPR